MCNRGCRSDDSAGSSSNFLQRPTDGEEWSLERYREAQYCCLWKPSKVYTSLYGHTAVQLMLRNQTEGYRKAPFLSLSLCFTSASVGFIAAWSMNNINYKGKYHDQLLHS